MLGIKPACLMSMEKNKDGLEENVELFNSRAYTKGMKLTVLCECKSRKLLFSITKSFYLTDLQTTE